MRYERIHTRISKAAEIASQRIKFSLQCHRNTKGKPLDFVKKYYLMQLYADPSPDITLRVPVQIGKTEWAVCDSLATASLGYSVFVVQPKFELRAVHVQDRYNRLIANSPGYQKFVQGSKRADSTNLKHFGDGVLRFVGSKVDTDMISFPADVVSIDELDRCDLANLELSKDRFEESELKFYRRTSTPTLPGSITLKNIDWYFHLADQRRWFVPCEACGHSQEIAWDTHLVDLQKDKEGRITNAVLLDPNWTEGKWRRAGQFIKLPCVRCGEALNRLARGLWVPSRQQEGFSETTSYTMSRLIAVTSEVERIWLEFESALGNPTAMQRVTNSYFAEPYVGLGNRFDETILDPATTICPPYLAPFEPPQGGCSMGIDVNEPLFDVWISDYPYMNREDVVKRCVFAGKVKREEDLHDLIARFNVKTVVIDAEPEVRLSLRFQQEARCEVWRCKYSHTEGTLLKDMRISDMEGLVEVDRTSSIDFLLQRFYRSCVALPTNYRELCNKRFLEEMKDSVRVLMEENGIERYVWIGEGSHTLHACNYDEVARRIGGFVSRGHAPSILLGSSVGVRSSGTKEMIDEYERLTRR